MSTIKSSTTTTTAYQVVADTTGALVIQTGVTPTTAVTVGSDQSVTFAGAVSLSGNQTTTGNLTVNGNTTLGDASTDTILMTGAPSIGGAGLGMGMGFRNRIINGGMVINQRNTTVSSNGAYTVDRWVQYMSGGGLFTAQQSSTIPNNSFTQSVLLTVTTADSSIASGDFYAFNQNIEGFNTADLGWGFASPSSVTLSFWARSSVAGLYCVSLYNNDGTRGYPSTYTLAANTWTYVTLTVPGCPDGTWGTTNGNGIIIRYDLGSGSSGNGTAGTWNTTAGFGANRTTGTVNWIATNGATFYITGVQLEKGSTATSFDYRPYGTELQLCQRYAFKRLADGSVDNYAPFGIGRYYTTTAVQLYVPFPVTMRTSPSSITVGGTIFVNDSGFGGADLTSPVLNESSCDGATITGGTTSVGVAGNATTFYASNTSVASILFSAEL